MLRKYTRSFATVAAVICVGVMIPASAWALKSMVAARDLPAGHRLTADDLVAKRPGEGVPPNKVEALVGGILRRPIGADTLVMPEDVKRL